MGEWKIEEQSTAVRDIYNRLEKLDRAVGNLGGEVVILRQDFDKLFNLLHEQAGDLYEGLIEFHN